MEFNNKLKPIPPKLNDQELKPFVDEYLQNQAKQDFFRSVKDSYESDAPNYEEGFDLNNEEDLLRYADTFMYSNPEDFAEGETAYAPYFEEWLAKHPQGSSLLRKYKDVGDKVSKKYIDPFVRKLLGYK